MYVRFVVFAAKITSKSNRFVQLHSFFPMNKLFTFRRAFFRDKWQMNYEQREISWYILQERKKAWHMHLNTYNNKWHLCGFKYRWIKGKSTEQMRFATRGTNRLRPNLHTYSLCWSDIYRKINKSTGQTEWQHNFMLECIHTFIQQKIEQYAIDFVHSNHLLSFEFTIHTRHMFQSKSHARLEIAFNSHFIGNERHLIMWMHAYVCTTSWYTHARFPHSSELFSIIG